MTANAVLRLQELCDHIIDFLPESRWDLEACALVSPAFTASAQRRLFHDIIFNRGCMDIDDSSILARYDEAGACNRFCAVLKRSPHLVPLVRRLRLSLDAEVLRPLCQTQFPNLHTVVFHRRRGGAASQDSLTLAKHLVGAQSLRRVGMMSLFFRSIHDLSSLFENCTSTLDSIHLHRVSMSGSGNNSGDDVPPRRVRIKALRWMPGSYTDEPWLLDPFAPFDFSMLADVEYGYWLTATVLKILDGARRSIRRLTVRAQHTVNIQYNSPIHPELLAQFPGITHLTIFSLVDELGDVETLLASLPAPNRLALLTLELTKRQSLQGNAIHRLAQADAIQRLANKPSFRLVIRVQRMVSGVGRIDVKSLIRTAFAELDSRGQLQVVVR